MGRMRRASAVLIAGLLHGAAHAATLTVPALGTITPASTVPPPVNATGSVGTATEYARADHTHVSSVWAKSALTDAAGNATFTFPVGFFDASPIISADIENTSPTTLYNRAVTAHTKDSVVIAVRSYVVTLGVLSLSVPAAGLQVNLIARRASP